MQKIEGRKFYISLGYIDEYVLTELENHIPTPRIIKSLIVEEDNNHVYVMEENNKIYLLPLMQVGDIIKEDNYYIFRYLIDSSKTKWHSNSITDNLKFNIIGIFEVIRDEDNVDVIKHLQYYTTNCEVLSDGRHIDLNVKLKEELLCEE